MEAELISKKELLDAAGISYGQLYRWRRKGLIPEDWFIRRSTFTGQETFFPREKVMARIERIKNMKDDVSLDDLKDVFSPNIWEIKGTPEIFINKGVISEKIFGLYGEKIAVPETLGFDQVLRIAVFEKLMDTGGINVEEAVEADSLLAGSLQKFKDGFCELLALRKLGTPIFIVISAPNQFFYDPGTRIAAKISISQMIEDLKLKLV